MMKRYAILMLSALALAACTEKPQELAGGKVKGSAQAWQGPASPYTDAQWKAGDKQSWEQHMQARTTHQNEYVRIGASR